MDKSAKPDERFEDLLGQFDHAMLVSVAADGSLHARPMAIADHEDGGRLCFATSSQSPKTEEVARQPRVAVTMQGNGVYLAVSGTATIVADPERVRSLWKAGWKLWFPEGPEDPRLVLMEVEPVQAEYWDRTGMQRLEFLWEAGKAFATGRAMADEALSGHGKLGFGWNVGGTGRND